ncbi:MAG: M50 family metallopeptidase [bacterium]|nr:M50 family metallopeptidase [bacterium]
MTLVLIILALSLLIIIHELGHFVAARIRGIKVEEFGLGYPPLAIKLFTWRGTIFSLNWIPFGGFVRMAGEQDMPQDGKKPSKDSYYAASIPSRLIVLLAGVFCNFVFGAITFAIIFTRFGIPQEVSDARIGWVLPDSPAAMAGVREGTSITALAVEAVKITISDTESAITFIQEHRGQEISLFARGDCAVTCVGEEQEYKITPRTEEETPEGQGAIGIVFTTSTPVFYPAWQMPFRGIAYGTQQAVLMGGTILEALGNMTTTLVQEGKLEKDLAGPVGIVSQAQTAGVFREGFFVALSFVGMLSINLAIMNLLPIPPLDGGKAVLTALESVINKRIIQKIEYYLSYGGYTILLGLIVLITIRDVTRLF